MDTRRRARGRAVTVRSYLTADPRTRSSGIRPGSDGVRRRDLRALPRIAGGGGSAADTALPVKSVPSGTLRIAHTTTATCCPFHARGGINNFYREYSARLTRSRTSDDAPTPTLARGRGTRHAAAHGTQGSHLIIIIIIGKPLCRGGTGRASAAAVKRRGAVTALREACACAERVDRQAPSGANGGTAPEPARPTAPRDIQRTAAAANTTAPIEVLQRLHDRSRPWRSIALSSSSCRRRGTHRRRSSRAPHARRRVIINQCTRAAPHSNCSRAAVPGAPHRGRCCHHWRSSTVVTNR
jgi:hypothetical protein